MSAGRYDIEIKRGASYKTAFTISDGETALDLTGAEIFMQARKAWDSEEPIIDLDLTDGISLTDVDGQFEIHIDETKTEELIPGLYQYDIAIKKDGDVTYWLEGNFKIEANITRLT
jgi:hypothetical protein